MTLEELQKKYQNIWEEYEKDYLTMKHYNWSSIKNDLYKDLTDTGYTWCVWTDSLIYSIKGFHPIILLIQIYKYNCIRFI